MEFTAKEIDEANAEVTATISAQDIEKKTRHNS